MLQINYWCQNLIQISLIGSFKSFQSQSAAIRLQLFCHSPPQKIIQNNNNPSSSVSNWVVSLWFGEPPAARLKLMQCGSCDYAAWFINSTRDFKTNNKTRASCAARWEKRQTTSNQSPRWWWWWKPVVFVCRPVFSFFFFRHLCSSSSSSRGDLETRSLSAALRRDFLNSPLSWLRRQETRRLGRQAWFSPLKCFSSRRMRGVALVNHVDPTCDRPQLSLSCHGTRWRFLLAPKHTFENLNRKCLPWPSLD